MLGAGNGPWGGGGCTRECWGQVMATRGDREYWGQVMATKGGGVGV